MAHPETVEAWKEWWFNQSIDQYKLGIDGKHYKGSDWIRTGELEIYRMPGIPQELVSSVTQGIEDILGLIGLSLHVTDRGVDDEMTMHVKRATTPDGKVDNDLLAKLLLSEPSRIQRPHADVVLLDRYFSDGDYRGASNFYDGTMALALTPERQNHQFTFKLSRHEAFHLIGYEMHHDVAPSIKGYPASNNPCLMRSDVMLINYPNPSVCSQCKDAVTGFWRGAEQKTSRKYFR